MSTLASSAFTRFSSAPAVRETPVTKLMLAVARWRSERRKAQELQDLWAIAQQDPRVMTDLVCALRRAD